WGRHDHGGAHSAVHARRGRVFIRPGAAPRRGRRDRPFQDLSSSAPASGVRPAAPRGRLTMSIMRFLRNRDGAIAPMFAIAAIPLIAATGAAIDYSRAYDARSSVQDALDAA